MSSSLSTEVADFFSRFAERRYRENELSDVTWALCHAVPKFAEVLAQFIGIEVSSGTAVKVDREVDLGAGNRIDISCSVDSVTIFVEVKIYDRNYHLRQYAQRIVGRPGSRLVLLTNHVLDREQQIEAKQLGWSVCSWRDFVSRVESAFHSDDVLVDAYLRYVRRVCNMVELREIRFDPNSLYSLVSLNALIEEVIGGTSHDDFTYSRYKSSRDHGPGWTGAYFQLQYHHADIQRQVWCFFGLFFEEPESTRLGVWIDRDWNAKFLGAARELENLPSDQKWSNTDGFGIAVAGEELQSLLSLPLAKQRSQLQSLFSKLLEPIEEQLARTGPLSQEEGTTPGGW